MRRRDTTRKRQTQILHEITFDDDDETLRAWRRADAGAESHMFSEDVRLSIMPYSSKRRIAIGVSPPNDDVADLIASGLTRDAWRDLEDSVTEFIRECAHTIVAYGVAQYETLFEEEADSKTPVAFSLAWVTPHTIRRRLGRWVQDIGKTRAEEQQRSRFSPVDIERIVTFHLPSPLTARQLLKMKQTLATVGTDLMPDGFLRGRGLPHGFDFAEFQRLRYRAEASATAAVGWNSRGSLAERVTDYYQLLREIRFRRFVISLRDAIIDTLNEALSEVLPRLGREGRIVLENHVTIGDVDRLSDDLARGLDLREGFRRVAAF